MCRHIFLLVSQERRESKKKLESQWDLNQGPLERLPVGLPLEPLSLRQLLQFWLDDFNFFSNPGGGKTIESKNFLMPLESDNDNNDNSSSNNDNNNDNDSNNDNDDGTERVKVT